MNRYLSSQYGSGASDFEVQCLNAAIVTRLEILPTPLLILQEIVPNAQSQIFGRRRYWTDLP